MYLDSKVWGPQYWFFLTTVAMTYPDYPNEVSKRKYYDFFQNMPLFIPDTEMGNDFSVMLDKYPVTPYLSSKDSLLRWINFIHNKYNVLLGKHEMSIDEMMENYFAQYAPKELHLHKEMKVKRLSKRGWTSRGGNEGQTLLYSCCVHIVVCVSNILFLGGIKPPYYIEDAHRINNIWYNCVSNSECVYGRKILEAASNKSEIL